MREISECEAVRKSANRVDLENAKNAPTFATRDVFKKKKEYTEFLDKFIGKKPGIVPKNSYSDLVKVSKKKTLNQEKILN